MEYKQAFMHRYDMQRKMLLESKQKNKRTSIEQTNNLIDDI